MTKVCPKCNKVNKDSAAFCENCGMELPKSDIPSSKSSGATGWWNKQGSGAKAGIILASLCCIGLIAIIVLGGMSSPDKTTSTNNTATSTQPKSTPTDNTAKPADNVLLEKNNVRMVNGIIYIGSEEVGTYKTVSSPPAVSQDVEKRMWRDKRVEYVDFSSTGQYTDYYTQYNGQWLKLSIDTTASIIPLEITDAIYTAME